jgi:hypothetical protein
MSFQSYITYDEYKDLEGTVGEEAFPSLEIKAQMWLDYFTFNRLKIFQEEGIEIPYEAKVVLTDFIDRLFILNNQRQGGDVITSYSNGVEKITYKLNTEAETTQAFYSVAMKFLPDYLIARSVSFDIRKYLQSNSNNT